MTIPFRVKTAAAACGSALLAAPALAAAAKPANAAKHGENTPIDLGAPQKVHDSVGASGGSIVRTLIGLVVVVALIYGIYWVLKLLKRGREQRATGGGTLESIASVPLGPSRSLHLVRAGADLVLVGVAEHGVTPIRAYTEAEARTAGLLPETTGGDADVIDVAAAAAPPARAQLPTVGQFLEDLRRRTVRT